MNDWVVVVKYRGTPERKRVFVEDIQHEDEAERLALLKLGVSSVDHETQAELIHERVSIEEPIHNWKELYEQALVDLEVVQLAYQKEKSLSAEHLKHAEKAGIERDRLIEDRIFALNHLALVRATMDRIQKRLEREK